MVVSVLMLYYEIIKIIKKGPSRPFFIDGGDGGNRTRVLLILTINDYTFSTTLVLNVPKY
jgi:hypothetical protein